MRGGRKYGKSRLRLTHLHPKGPVWATTGGARGSGLPLGEPLSLNLTMTCSRRGRVGLIGGVADTILAMCPLSKSSLQSSMHDYAGSSTAPRLLFSTILFLSLSECAISCAVRQKNAHEKTRATHWFSPAHAPAEMCMQSLLFSLLHFKICWHQSST